MASWRSKSTRWPKTSPLKVVGLPLLITDQGSRNSGSAGAGFYKRKRLYPCVGPFSQHFGGSCREKWPTQGYGDNRVSWLRETHLPGDLFSIR